MFERINEASTRMERQQDIARATELARHLPEVIPRRERSALARRIRRTQRMLRGETAERGTAPVTLRASAPEPPGRPPMSGGPAVPPVAAP